MPYAYNPLLGAGLDQTAAPGGGTTSPGGSNTQIQFNDGGTFAGNVNLTWDKTTNLLSVGGFNNYLAQASAPATPASGFTLYANASNTLSWKGANGFTRAFDGTSNTANRTYTLPDASGTVALVAGSSGQIVYNNAGVYAGVSTTSIDGSGNITLSGRWISSLNGAASAPPVALTGTWFTGGGAIATKPQFLIEPTGTTSTAWSNNGTGLGVNAASGFTGNLLDLQVNGSSKVNVDTNGAIICASRIVSTPADVSFDSAFGGIRLGAGKQLGWSNAAGNQGGGSQDTQLWRDAASIIAQRVGTTAQTYRIYNTYTDASNYERLSIDWTSNVCYARPQNAGTGSARLFVPVTGSTTVASLPSAATAGTGARSFVTDATATTFLSTVAGGGTNKVPVVSDGTNWLIG